MVFFPMHILGVGGHMRRIYNPMQYEFLQGMQPMNVMITLSALALGLSQIPFVFNFFATVFRWNAKWFRVLTQAVSGLVVGFIGYKSAAVMFEGLMEPEASTGGRIVGTIVFVALTVWIYRYLEKNMAPLGADAPQNPWDASTLEWVAPTPAPHGNFGPTLPVVRRGPYEYSVPGEEADWAPQTEAIDPKYAEAGH